MTSESGVLRNRFLGSASSSATFTGTAFLSPAIDAPILSSPDGEFAPRCKEGLKFPRLPVAIQVGARLAAREKPGSLIHEAETVEDIQASIEVRILHTIAAEAANDINGIMARELAEITLGRPRAFSDGSIALDSVYPDAAGLIYDEMVHAHSYIYGEPYFTPSAWFAWTVLGDRPLPLRTLQTLWTQAGLSGAYPETQALTGYATVNQMPRLYPKRCSMFDHEISMRYKEVMADVWPSVYGRPRNERSRPYDNLRSSSRVYRRNP